LPKKLFAEFVFAEKYCLNFAKKFICGIADLPILYLPKSIVGKGGTSVTRRLTEKCAQFCPNKSQNGALVNMNFCPKK
jgi:hypothetical protein